MTAPRVQTSFETLSHGQIPEHWPTNTNGVPYVATAPGVAGGGSETATISAVNDAAAETTILAANTARKNAIIVNDSTSILYLLFGSGTPSSTNYSLKLNPQDVLTNLADANGCYTGIIKGIWSADASGAARVTEFT